MATRQPLGGVSLECPRARSSPSSAPTAPARSSLIRPSPASSGRGGTHCLAGRDITGLDSHEICNLGIGQFAEGRQLFPTSDRAGESGDGRHAAARARNMKQTMESVFELFPSLAERKQQLAGTLSGGEQQMLAIGRCLMGRPELIMFDEPSLGLAPNVVQQLLQTIHRLNQKGLTVLLVEQNVAVSLKLSQHAYVLENGRIVVAGSGHELLNDQRVRRAYLGL